MGDPFAVLYCLGVCKGVGIGWHSIGLMEEVIYPRRFMDRMGFVS